MLRFPGCDVINDQEVVGVGRSLVADVDYYRGGDEGLQIDRINRILWEILPCHPMDRRVEMGPCMLVNGKVIPVEVAAFVARELLQLESRALLELWRKHEHRRFVRQRLGEVDNANGAGSNRVSKIS